MIRESLRDWHSLHPAWKVCIGLALGVFVMLSVGTKFFVEQQEVIKEQKALFFEIQEQQKAAEERGYAIRALAGCFDLINDQEVEVTKECTSERVVVYYPPSICAKLPATIPDCGLKAEVVVPALNSRQTFSNEGG